MVASADRQPLPEVVPRLGNNGRVTMSDGPKAAPLPVSPVLAKSLNAVALEPGSEVL